MKKQIDEFLQTLDRSSNTVRTYRNALILFERHAGKHGSLSLDNYVSFLKSIKDLSPSTKHVYKTALTRFYIFHRAATLQDMREISDHYIKRVPNTLPEFDEAAIRKLIDYCAKLRGDLLALRDKAFVYTCADGGFRISEACQLRRGQIKWEEKYAVIVGKGAKKAKVRFSDRSIAALRAYLALRDKTLQSNQLMADQPLFARHDKMASKKLRGVSKSGSGMREAIKCRMEEAGIPRAQIRLHDFRHYFTTLYYRASKDILKTRNQARHSSVVTTQRYAHLAEDDGTYDKIFNISPEWEKD